MKKITESVFPVMALLSAIFFILLYVEYRATLDAERVKKIHITASTIADTVPENVSERVVEVDYSDDPRVVKAQSLVAEKKFDAAEAIYFEILAQKPSAQLYNWLGTLYLKKEAYAQAAASFSTALKLNPGYYRARYNRALVYSALEMNTKAIEDYIKVIEQFDTHVKSYFNLGLLYYREKQFDHAVKTFGKAAGLSSGEKKVKSLYLLGKSYLRLKPPEKEKAQESFNAVIRLKPNHIGARLALVSLAFADNTAGQQKRLERYRVMLELEPDNVAIYRAMAKSYLQLHREKEALKILQKGLLYAPDNLSLKFEVVSLLIKLEKETEAIGLLQNMLTADPENARAYFLLGRMHYKRGALSEALEAYQKVLELKPKGSPELFNNLGLLYTKMGEYDKAAAVYEKALVLRPEYPEVYYNLAHLSLRQKRSEAATHYFETAIAMRPDYTQAYEQLGHLYMKSGVFSKAEQAFQKVLEHEPKKVRTRLNLALLYMKMKMWEKAERLYTSILKDDESYFTAWFNLGLVYYQQKRYSESQVALEKAVALEPESKKARRALAKSYSAQGDYKKATTILYRLLAQDPSDIKTRLAYARSYYRARKRNTALREYKKVLKLDPQNRVALKMIEKIETRKRKKHAKQ